MNYGLFFRILELEPTSYYRPIVEQGVPSELTAAVLNLPRREGDGGANGASGSTPALTKVNASAKPTAQIKPTAAAAISITFLDGLFKKKKKESRIGLVLPKEI